MSNTDILKQIGNSDKIIALLEKELLSFEESYKKTKSKRVKNKIRKINCEIDKQITQQAILKINAYQLINKIKNEQERWVLICHFICLLTIEETAEQLHYSSRHIQRLLATALKKIDALSF